MHSVGAELCTSDDVFNWHQTITTEAKFAIVSCLKIIGGARTSYPWYCTLCSSTANVKESRHLY